MKKKLATIAVFGVTGATAVAGWAVTVDGSENPASTRPVSAVAGKSSETKEAKENKPCSLGRYSKYRKFVRTEKAWPNKPGWRVSGWGPDATLNLSKAVQVSNSVSGTFGLSNKAVSATVGFNVTFSETTTFSATRNMTKKAHYTLRAGTVHKVYIFNVYEKRGKYHFFSPTAARCAWDGKPDHYVGTGTAKEFWTFDYRVTKGRKA